ncbi:MAG TPA: class II fumarate hydratase [Gammaproteobacteria bacterium]
MKKPEVRIEKDSLGEIEVPANALYGAQTQRAIENFPVSGLTMPRGFIRALGLVKCACAAMNTELGLLDAALAEAVQTAAFEVAEGKYDSHFPIDVFQTGSGTSTNMNANEVIARLASDRLRQTVHPNNHVNMSQSSNDVIPSCIQVSASLEIVEELMPALEHLASIIEAKGRSLADVVKTGRTHLMDAVPLTLAQELSGWAAQVRQGMARIGDSLRRLRQLPIGGTAIGTGINARPDFGLKVSSRLATMTTVEFTTKENYFEGLSTQDAAVEMSGQLRTLAVSLLKICNDLRWMNSGPLAGLAEIELPTLQPGSSIMPGKVNPVIPEAVAMVCAQVIGNDAAITIAGQSGNFQLNVMLPVIAFNLLQSIELLTNGSRLLADKAIRDFKVNRGHIEETLSRNPILITALNRRIGYEKGAEIVKQAYAQKRPILEVAAELTGLPSQELRDLLNPAELTKGGAEP